MIPAKKESPHQAADDVLGVLHLGALHRRGAVKHNDHVLGTRQGGKVPAPANSAHKVVPRPARKANPPSVYHGRKRGS
jgi:hypothetical protein